MSSAPDDTTEPTVIKTDEPKVIRKPITFPVEPDDDDDEVKDGPRSTKNDRELELDMEDAGETDTVKDNTADVPVAEPEVRRKPIVVEAEPED